MNKNEIEKTAKELVEKEFVQAISDNANSKKTAII